MEKKITLFHGSEKVIEHPVFGEGKKHNDFGLGFYCTESEALAKEWAVSSLRDGFANRYTLDTEYLRVLHLNSPDYTILNWIAVLVEHRLFSIKTPVARRAKQYLIDNFSVNVNAYDLITGYRADDSYFDYAESFLNNAISVEQLSQAMRLGKLGEQVVIKSQFAFSNLKFEGFSIAEKDKNLLRIARERANADRKLRPKKTHTGYVVLTSSEKEYRYKTMRKENAVAGLWETALQSPYSVDFTEEQARALTEELVQPNENGETIVGRIGIDTYYHGSYEDLLHDQRRSGRQAEDLNIMLKPKLRANYKTGYWEVIFLHTKPLGLVPAEMRARG